jgi:hypothetical protein
MRICRRSTFTRPVICFSLNNRLLAREASLKFISAISYTPLDICDYVERIARLINDNLYLNTSLSKCHLHFRLKTFLFTISYLSLGYSTINAKISNKYFSSFLFQRNDKILDMLIRQTELL